MTVIDNHVILTRTRDAQKSGRVKVYGSTPLDLSVRGWGEVEFYVDVSYNLSFALARMKAPDWYDARNKRLTGSDVPTSEIERAVNRFIDANPQLWVDGMIEKLR